MPNGWRYPLVGETRQRRFDGIHFKPRKTPENAQTPTSRVHALLGAVWLTLIVFLNTLAFLLLIAWFLVTQQS